jgi:hypothetical protein
MLRIERGQVAMAAMLHTLQLAVYPRADCAMACHQTLENNPLEH